MCCGHKKIKATYTEVQDAVGYTFNISEKEDALIEAICFILEDEEVLKKFKSEVKTRECPVTGGVNPIDLTQISRAIDCVEKTIQQKNDIVSYKIIRG